MTCIQIPYDRGIRLAMPEQIIRVEAYSNYSKIYFISGHPMTVAKVLQWFQLQLPEEIFSRVHRSHLVNKLYIQYISIAKQNTVVLRNGEKICMSRRKKALLMAG
jgi:two-component system, LytTR family, response regulator